MDSIDFKSPGERYRAIGDAIREKSGTTELLQPADMPRAILDIVSGDGGVVSDVKYKSIVYNKDDTITLIDADDIEHIMACVYEDDKLIGVNYDGKAIRLGYEGEELKSVGKTDVDLSNAPQIMAKTVKADSCVSQVMLPVIVPTVTAEINSNIIADSSASLEE